MANDIAKPEDYIKKLDEVAGKVVSTFIVPIDNTGKMDSAELMGAIVASAQASNLEGIISVGDKATRKEVDAMFNYAADVMVDAVKQTKDLSKPVGDGKELPQKAVIDSITRVALSTYGQNTATDLGVHIEVEGNYTKAKEKLGIHLKTMRENGLPQLEYRQGSAYGENKPMTTALAHAGAASDEAKLYAVITLVAKTQEEKDRLGVMLRQSASEHVNKKADAALEELAAARASGDKARIREALAKAGSIVGSNITALKTADAYRRGDIDGAAETVKQLPGAAESYQKQLGAVNERPKLT